jgi:hypothetical protein
MSTPTVPTNHLADQMGRTSDLLTHLTDHQLEEQITWLRARRAGSPSSEVSYMFSKQLSSALSEQERRSGE